jgi:L-iditol 2-dehydrogenase
MKAAVIESPKTIVIKDVPKPTADGTKVLVKVAACGVCGSDTHFWHTPDVVGMRGKILGHEFCGFVDDPGSRADLKAGDWVCGMEVNPCGECRQCKKGNECGCHRYDVDSLGVTTNGAYAEYVAVRPDLVRRLPKNVSPTLGALIEPCAVSLHAVKRSGCGQGDSLLITGAGPVGFFAAACAKKMHLGIDKIVITDIDPHRIETAAKSGFVEHVFNGNDAELEEKLLAVSNGSGFDAVIETTSVPKVRTQASRMVNHGGTLVNVGFMGEFTFDTFLMTVREFSVVGSRYFAINDFDHTLGLIAREELDIEKYAKPITIEKLQSAFVALDTGKSQVLKYVVTM